MHTNTIEGLVGARTNVNLLNTPMQVFKEAENKGDTATMERAMKYAGEVADDAEEYKTKADKGMQEDAKETKEKAEAEREKMIQKHREEREEFEKRMEEGGTENNSVSDSANVDGEISPETTDSTLQAESVTYTKTGEVSQVQAESGANISVSV